MELSDWLRLRDGIAHRADAWDAGYSAHAIRRAIAGDDVRRIGRRWIARSDAPPELCDAAEAGGALTCVSLARRRGWWVPPEASELVHVHLAPGAAVPRIDVVPHWSRSIGPDRPREIVASVEDALAHAARCFPLDQAVAIWESAIRLERLSVDSLRQVRWRDAVARRCAEHLRPGTDSSLETVFHVRLSSWGVPLRMQVQLAGHSVDFLIGTHLVVQIDGWSFHSSSADRTRDIAHDAALRMRGFTVLRFSYAQVIHRWQEVESVLSQAIARGLHLGPH
jgi:very-short-patch-repair endonuclease